MALTKEELGRYRGQLGFNLWQVERDYLQHLALAFLYGQAPAGALVFKGGTALQKAYGLGRFSTDLGFSLASAFDLLRAAESTAKQVTIFGFEASAEETRGARASLALRVKGPLYDGSTRAETKLLLEVSKRGDLLLPPSVREVVPVYEDLQPYAPLVMDLSEMLSEKVRALTVRSKARDLYDTWFLLRKGVRIDLDLVQKKLDYCGRAFDRASFIEGVKGLSRIWNSELTPLVRTLPKFDEALAELDGGLPRTAP